MVRAPLAPLHILVADDDAALARVYAAFGESRGHYVRVARDGLETVLAAATEPFDLILLDVGMPRVDGRDALAALKANALTREIPVVVVSGDGGDQALRDLLLDLGAADVLEKPLDLALAFNRLERTVGDTAGNRGAHAPA